MATKMKIREKVPKEALTQIVCLAIITIIGDDNCD